jgi:hypothetical protein
MFALERLSKELYIEIKDKNYNETDRKGFLRAKNSFRDDILSRASEAGINDPGMQKHLILEMKSRNNPIELE